MMPGKSAAVTTSTTSTSAATATVSASPTLLSVAGITTISGTADRFEDLELIGTGAYGSVYRARYRGTSADRDIGPFVALKKVRVPLTEDGIPPSTLREISLLKHIESLEHPNIVRLHDICLGRRLEKEQQLCLVFEHVDQDLTTYLEKCPPPGLSLDRIKSLTFQIMSGIDFLHSNRIVHRDLKPQNILVTGDSTVKLADFGLARIYDINVAITTVVVTLWYRSPEVLLHSNYATPVDIWSCGCIFAELYRRKPLFCGQSEIDQLSKIFEIIGTPSAEDWPDDVSLSHNSLPNLVGVPLEMVIQEICPQGKDLMQKMLLFSPAKRITASETLQHPYFRDDNYVPIVLTSSSNRSTPSSSLAIDDGSPSDSQPDQ